MKFNATTTVGELAIAMPGATRVFEKFGIDYCCCGQRTLVDACERVSLSVDEVVRTLEQEKLTAQENMKGRSWRDESLTSLAAYIVDQHHFFTKQELTRLEKLLDKVYARHGANHPEMAEVQQLFSRLKQDLIPHMLKEEQVLFPYIARLEEVVSEGREIPQPFFGTVRNPVKMMMTEHDAAGELLTELRRVTSGYTAPADACASYQTLYQGLAALEADLHEHIHLENNLLFPRAVELEEAVAAEMQPSANEFNEHRCFGH